MQAGEEFGEVYPEQSYYNGRHTRNRQEAVNAWVLFAEHIAKMEIPDIDQPGCQRPEFFRVPAPVIAPGQFTPIAAEDKSERQQGKADTNHPVRCLFRGQQVFTRLGGFAGQLSECLDSGLCHKDIRQHINGDVGRKKPALQGRRQLLRLGVKHKTGWEEHYYADEHIGGVATDAQETPAEQRDRINHAEKQKHLEKILQRHVTHVVPAVAIRDHGDCKTYQIQNVSGFGPAQKAHDKSQQICGHSGVDQIALDGVFNFHLLASCPQSS